jgi:hypothetical protein
MLTGDRRRVFLALLILGGIILDSPLAGCMQVIRQEAPYYKEGPQQAGPPDGFFEPGTRVWVMGEKNTYARVLSMDGRAGHVWNRDIVSVFEWDKLQRQARGSGAKPAR